MDKGLEGKLARAIIGIEGRPARLRYTSLISALR